MRRFATGLLAGVLLAAPSAMATKLIPFPGQKKDDLKILQIWTDASRVPTPNGKVRVKLTDKACGDGGACISIPRPIIQVSLPSGKDRVARYEFMHELGHVYDVLYIGRRERAQFKRILGTRARWWQGVDPPGEKFAEAYSFCSMGIRDPAHSTEWYGYGYEPTRRRHRQACALIRKAK